MMSLQRSSSRLVRNATFCVLLVFKCGIADAQRVQLDSLPTLLSRLTNTDSHDECARICESISVTYARSSQPLLSLNWIDVAIGHSTDSVTLSRRYKIKAQILTMLDRHDDILIATRQAKMFGGNKLSKDEMIILQNLDGIAYTFTARYEEAFRQTYNALLMASTSNNRKGILYSTGNLALAYYKVKDYRMAIHYYKLSRKLIEKEDPNLGILLANLALAYVHANQIDSAYWCIKEFPGAVIQPGYNDSAILYTYAVVNEKMGNLDSALYYYSKSLEVACTQDNHRYIAENNLSIAQIKLRALDTAHVRQSLFIAEQLSLNWKLEDILVKVYAQQISLSKIQDDYNALIIAQKKFITKNKEIYNAHLTLLLAKRKSQHFEREHQASIHRFNELVRINEEIERNQIFLNYVFVALLLMISSLVLLLVIAFRTKLKHMLNLQKILLNRSRKILIKKNEPNDLLGKAYLAVFRAQKILDKASDYSYFKK